LIWFFRGHRAAIRLLQGTDDPALSVISVMELYQGARSQKELRTIRQLLHEGGLRVIPINESISQFGRNHC